AYFPGSRRLAVETGGSVTIYDTSDHQIGGVSQQQGGDSSLTFTSQHGLVRVGDLRVVRGEDAERPPPAAAPAPHQPVPAGTVGPSAERAAAPLRADQSHDVLALIERLAALREKNILSEEEFAAKKTELLSRL